jgi:hypothetical protein
VNADDIPQPAAKPPFFLELLAAAANGCSVVDSIQALPAKFF